MSRRAARISGAWSRELVDAKDLVVDVVAEQRQEILLQLAAGVDVEGVVRDAAGAAVPGAQIWLSS